MRMRYKALYLHQLQAAGEERDRAKRAERELARLRDVLASAGERILARTGGIGKLLDPFETPGVVNEDGIFLPPVAFECATAFIESTSRMTNDYVGWMVDYTWKRKRVIALP